MTPSEFDVSCPHCKAPRLMYCKTPAGHAYYRTAVVGDRKVNFLAAHAARKKRSDVMHLMWPHNPNQRFRHPHPAVGIAERTPNGCHILRLRDEAPRWRTHPKRSKLSDIWNRLKLEQVERQYP